MQLEAVLIRIPVTSGQYELLNWKALSHWIQVLQMELNHTNRNRQTVHTNNNQKQKQTHEGRREKVYLVLKRKKQKEVLEDCTGKRERCTWRQTYVERMLWK